ncbi:FK506-binding protein-like [Anthonomus grandis grandis]|uniref:FK506-binding protein-like n=1 Tax=Anthonomus grandis grandis TaxID=2921223 RepID=UPI0021654DA4|nr:FK506-binding protein-like [Anthonomus grandis grandis]
MEEWTSPDDKIFKQLIKPGVFGQKPFEGSCVRLNIVDCPPQMTKFNNVDLVMGELDGAVGRMLDISVCTMHLNEQAKFTLILDLTPISAIIELVELKFNGFIFEWGAKKKLDMALGHKNKGAEFFAENNLTDAAHRFSKGLKLLCSIPLDVEYPPQVIDGVSIQEINLLKEKLYNNLSSCYFKQKIDHMVIPLCEKVLSINGNNVKALYRIGVAYKNDKNYEKAYEALRKLNQLEPQNKAGAEQLAKVNLRLKEANVRVNNIMKKMVIDSLK